MKTEENRSEDMLIALAKCGDMKAFEELMEPYWSRIFRFALSRLRDEDLAEEARQRTCIVVCTAIANYRGESSLYVWLFGVTLNVVRDMCREKTRDIARQERIQETPKSQYSDSSPFANVAYGDLSGCIEDAIRFLPNMSREILLARVREVSGSETAEEFGITGDVVKTRMYRARKHVIPQLREHGWR